MKLFGRIASAFRGGQKSASISDANFSRSLRELASTARGELTAPMNQHVWVFAAIDAKATALSQAKLQVIRYSSQDQDDQGAPVRDDDPFQRVFRKPNSLMTGTDMVYAINACLDLYGEALIHMTGAGDQPYRRGTPPVVMRVVPNPTRWKPQVERGVLVGWFDAMGQPVPYDEVLQIRNWNPADSFRGLGPTEPLGVTLAADHGAQVFNQSWYENGADPGAILSVEGGVDEAGMAQLRRAFEDRHKGAMKARRVAVLPQGVIWTPVEVSQKNMQWLEGREWNREEILAAYRVPKQSVGLIDDVNRATASVTERAWWTNVLIPRLRKIEEAFSEFFFPSDVLVNCEFSLDRIEALQEDYLERLEKAKGLTLIGVPLNEAIKRADLGIGDVEGGDVGFIPGGVQPLMFAGEKPEPPKPPIPPKAPKPPKDDEQEEAEKPKEGKGKPKKAYPVRAKMLAEGGRKAVVDAWEKAVVHPGRAKLERAVRSYFAATKRATVESFVRWAARVGLGEEERSVNGVRTKIVSLSPTQVSAFLLTTSQLQNEMQAHVEGPLRGIASGAIAGLGKDLGGFQVVQPDLDTPWVRDIVSRRLGSMVQMAAKDRELVRAVLMKRVQEDGFGSIREIQQELNKTFDAMSNVRSLRIARTETGTLANGVRYSGMQAEGVEKHEWVTAGDDIVRPSDGDQAAIGDGNHRALDGVVVEIGERFPNGLLHPNDPSGDPEEIISCRCVAAPVE